ncbi:MAG TPA: glycosyltransferase family 4 protein [Alphaproteobacteria bacterium]|nr:glycosyltransferase family 4 protein [Alphaproteobacteria bacterium]USO06571.1 MAG: glycosyltransferase family 4 protein [Rhodospirillales bacterium]HOO81191.1 glycosyltransferase family 4 protein [Alphaproteobacteria bacterium]
MRVLYCHDNIYQQCESGTVYSPGQFPYEYWKIFLDNFDHLVVIGRGAGLHDKIDQLNISSGPRVSFALFPNINTPVGRLKYARRVNKRLERIVADADAVIIRAVSDMGWLAFKHALRMNKPIALEMAACAWDSTWNHGNKLGKIYAPIRYLHDRIIARHADFVMYVSYVFLQRRYPTNGEVAHISNVRIDKPDEQYVDQRLKAIKVKQDEMTAPYTIGLIGNLDNRIKGVDLTLRALAKVEEEKPGCFIFHHLGPGDPEPHMALAHALGISERIRFDGMIKSGEGVMKWLRKVDLYLQPSFQEGIPRATIEAMSTACPIIASTAGGIPELIKEEWLIKPGDVDNLARLILKMLDNPKFQYEAGLNNYIASLDYTNDILVPRRQGFWGAFAKFAREKAQ